MKAENETAEEFRDRMRSIQSMKRSQRVVEGEKDGVAFKKVTDDLGNVVTQRGDKQDVTINPRSIRVASVVRPTQ